MRMNEFEDYWDDWEEPVNRGEEIEFESDLIHLIIEGLRDNNQKAIDCAFGKIREWYIKENDDE